MKFPVNRISLKKFNIKFEPGDFDAGSLADASGLGVLADQLCFTIG
jgi:hypothetical protein